MDDWQFPRAADVPLVARDNAMTVYGPLAIVTIRPAYEGAQLHLTQDDMDHIGALTGTTIRFANASSDPSPQT